MKTLLILLSFMTSVYAEDRASWFKSLVQPGSGVSCCDVSDCRRTTADWHNGQWYTNVGGNMTPIPPATELETKSIDGDAYVCASPSHHIYCFVKPWLSY